MAFALSSGGFTAIAAGFAALLAGAFLAPSPANAVEQPTTAKRWPSRIEAGYRITFNGFEIGNFGFAASSDGKGYSLTGDTSISLLLGAVSWIGKTRASGQLAAAPRPKGFAFEFEGMSKKGSIHMAFNGARVADVTVLPDQPIVTDVVPLQAHHRQSVLDPLSALLALARPKTGSPCKQKLQVFDGQQRFDLVLSARAPAASVPAQASLAAAAGIATSGETQHLCTVGYRPIAGYRPDKATLALARSTGITMRLETVNGADLLVPVRVELPTVAGTVRIIAKSLRIVPAPQQVASGR